MRTVSLHLSKFARCTPRSALTHLGVDGHAITDMAVGKMWTLSCNVEEWPSLKKAISINAEEWPSLKKATMV